MGYGGEGITLDEKNLSSDSWTQGVTVSVAVLCAFSNRLLALYKPNRFVECGVLNSPLTNIEK